MGGDGREEREGRGRREGRTREVKRVFNEVDKHGRRTEEEGGDEGETIRWQLKQKDIDEPSGAP